MVDGVRPLESVGPGRVSVDSQGVVNCSRHALGRLLAVLGLAAICIRGSDHLAIAGSGPGKENTLHRTPVISTGQLVVLRQVEDPGCATELAGGDDQRVVQKSSFVEVIDQCREGLVGRGQHEILEVIKGVAVRVETSSPQVDLHHTDTDLDQSGGHQQRIAEQVAAVAVQCLGVCIFDVERAANATGARRVSSCTCAPDASSCTLAQLQNTDGPDEECRPDAGGAVLLPIVVEFNFALETLDLSGLASTTRSVTVYGNPQLTSVDLSDLERVEEFVQIRDNTGLATLSLGSLASVGEYLSLQTNVALLSLALPALVSTGDFLQIRTNIALSSLDLSALISTGSGDLVVVLNGELSITDTFVDVPVDVDLESFLPARGPRAVGAALQGRCGGQ